MGRETFISYWIGEEEVPLDKMPAYVNVVPLAFVNIGSNNELDFKFLTRNYDAGTIQNWIKKVRANGTKIILSINSPMFSQVDPTIFAKNVLNSINQWGADGVDIDYEGDNDRYNKSKQENVIEVVKQLRSRLGNRLITAPVFEKWLDYPDFLGKFAVELDYLTTMDYSPYQDFDETIRLCEKYAQAIGTNTHPEFNKLAVGVSCMGGSKYPGYEGYRTPLDDVIRFCRWTPGGGRKKGVMLYTFSYDFQGRIETSGSYTKAIHKNLG